MVGVEDIANTRIHLQADSLPNLEVVRELHAEVEEWLGMLETIVLENRAIRQHSASIVVDIHSAHIVTRKVNLEILDWLCGYGEVAIDIWRTEHILGWGNLLVEGFYTILNDVFALRETGIVGEDGATIHERYNGSGATVMGLNIEGKAAYMPWIEASVGITLQLGKYKEPEQWSETAPAATDMFRSPNVYGYFALTSQPVKNFKIDLSGNYMGRMYMQHYAGGILPDGSTLQEDRIERTNPFFDLGLKLSYDFKIWKTIGLQVNGGIRNILNSYQKDFDRGANRDSGYIYGPSLPRSIFVGAKLSF